MTDSNSFCTCRDLSCPMNPRNHNDGCTPCIKKNLEQSEIPSCFFNKVDGTADLESYYFKDFADLVAVSSKKQ